MAIAETDSQEQFQNKIMINKSPDTNSEYRAIFLY